MSFMEKLKADFDNKDLDGSGSVSKDEIQTILADKEGYTPERIEKFIENMMKADFDKDGEVSWKEFLRFVEEKNKGDA